VSKARAFISSSFPPLFSLFIFLFILGFDIHFLISNIIPLAGLNIFNDFARPTIALLVEAYQLGFAKAVSKDSVGIQSDHNDY